MVLNVVEVESVEVGLDVVIKPKLVIEAELSVDVGTAELSVNVETAESSADVETADDDAVKVDFTTLVREDVLDASSGSSFFSSSSLSPSFSVSVAGSSLRLLSSPEPLLMGESGVGRRGCGLGTGMWLGGGLGVEGEDLAKRKARSRR